MNSIIVLKAGSTCPIVVACEERVADMNGLVKGYWVRMPLMTRVYMYINACDNELPLNSMATAMVQRWQEIKRIPAMFRTREIRGDVIIASERMRGIAPNNVKKALSLIGYRWGEK